MSDQDFIHPFGQSQPNHLRAYGLGQRSRLRALKQNPTTKARAQHWWRSV